MTERDALSPQEVADRSGFHSRTILREIERGNLAASEPVSGDYRILVDEYMRWLGANPVKPRSRKPKEEPRRRRDGGAAASEKGSFDDLMSRATG